MRVIVNLDQKAAQCAQKIVEQGKDKKLENLITKALGVLQEQGVYALLLFLFSENSKVTNTISNNLNGLLNEVGLKDKDGKVLILDNKRDSKYVLEFYSENILDNLDSLFLVRDIYEQTLIYARYGAKAWGKAETTKKENIDTQAISDKA